MRKKRSSAPREPSGPSPKFRPLEAAMKARLAAEHAHERNDGTVATKKPPKSPPAARTDEPALAEDDRELLRQLMVGTVPLDARSQRIPRTASGLARREPAKVDPSFDPDAEARERLRALVEGTATFEVIDDGSRIEGRRADVDPRTLRRLRRGEHPVDGTLDLHGMTVVEARRAVERFLEARRRSHDRVLLVVHGKGAHSPRGQGILRGEIGAWLSDGPASRHVACFATAREEDGGSGAIYVMLRR